MKTPPPLTRKQKRVLLENIAAARGTAFQKLVWSTLCSIRTGKTVSYAELALAIGKPKAARAVANAVGKNPFAPDVPCHRVVRSDGTLGGYSGKGGTRTKIRLLRKEGVTLYTLDS